jgi:hypothetical protein
VRPEKEATEKNCLTSGAPIRQLVNLNDMKEFGVVLGASARSADGVKAM